jgi:hypothetical protein
VLLYEVAPDENFEVDAVTVLASDVDFDELVAATTLGQSQYFCAHFVHLVDELHARDGVG